MEQTQLSYEEICSIVGSMVMESRRLEKEFQAKYHKDINELKQEINRLKDAANEKPSVSS
jgi:hypothetical protein